jgi:hypothetical protein
LHGKYKGYIFAIAFEKAGIIARRGAEKRLKKVSKKASKSWIGIS